MSTNDASYVSSRYVPFANGRENSYIEKVLDARNDTISWDNSAEPGKVAQLTEALHWVQHHPVLAAVLWVCSKVIPSEYGANETLITPTECSEERIYKSGSRSTSRLSWTDEHGGSLAEYFDIARTDDQYLEDDSPHECSDNFLLETLPTEDEKSDIFDDETDHFTTSEKFTFAHTIDNRTGCSVGAWSPQWGWYVTLTPPKEEFYRSYNESRLHRSGV